MGLLGPTESAEDKKARVLKSRENVKYTEHNEDLDALLGRYGSDAKNGLSTAKAEEGFHKYGPNELTPPATTPQWVKFLQELTGFFSLLLWLGGFLCLPVAYVIQGNMGDLVLGVVLYTVVLATGIFSFYQNSKADSLMDEFKKLKPPSVKVFRDGKICEKDASKITLGDIVHVKTGDLIPADIRVLEVIGNATVDNSSLTGESEPQKRKAECTDNDPAETQARRHSFIGSVSYIGFTA
jgi:sodium/potassium-transporting ATPase subunit alpha